MKKDIKTQYHCPNCKYLTDRKNNLKRHLSTMHENSLKLLECCNTIFANKSSLKEHVSQSHTTEGYPCMVCQKRFSRKALLKRHSVIHDQAKTFKCSSCDYLTCHKSNLHRHYKKHRTPSSNPLNYCTTFKGDRYNNTLLPDKQTNDYVLNMEKKFLSFEKVANDYSKLSEVFKNIPTLQEPIKTSKTQGWDIIDAPINKVPSALINVTMPEKNNGFPQNCLMNPPFSNLNPISIPQPTHSELFQFFLMENLFLFNIGYYHFFQRLFVKSNL